MKLAYHAVRRLLTKMDECRKLANSGVTHKTRKNQHCGCANANRVNNYNKLLVFSLESIQILIFVLVILTHVTLF